MTEEEMSVKTNVALFGERKIRRTLHDNEWWFSVSDVVEALTDSLDPSGYIKDMRRRDESLSKGWGQIATPLSIQTEGGPQKLNCANIEGVLRIIQSIPSPKAEPFKRWLAKVGYERVQEIENPELGMQRTKTLYEKKGYPKDWIDKRLRGIACARN
jgi:prophage antirepressor-like protein